MTPDADTKKEMLKQLQQLAASNAKLNKQLQQLRQQQMPPLPSDPPPTRKGVATTKVIAPSKLGGGAKAPRPGFARLCFCFVGIVGSFMAWGWAQPVEVSHPIATKSLRCTALWRMMLIIAACSAIP